MIDWSDIEPMEWVMFVFVIILLFGGLIWRMSYGAGEDHRAAAEAETAGMGRRQERQGQPVESSSEWRRGKRAHNPSAADQPASAPPAQK